VTARRAPLGLVAGARSGDKGGNANLGVWTRTDEAYRQVQEALTGPMRRTMVGADAARQADDLLLRLDDRTRLRTIVDGGGADASPVLTGYTAIVETALGQAWALLAPSIWPEPLGLTAIEAITRGVPAIASAGGGFSETVEHGVSGSLVPNGDERALADCLIRAVDGGPVAVPENVVRRLRQRHDPAHHTALLTAAFREAIGTRRRRDS